MNPRFLSLVLFLGLLFQGTIAIAVNEQYIQGITGSSIVVNANFIVKDDKFLTSSWSTIEKNVSVKDVVFLEINDDATTFYNYPFTCAINVKIEYRTADSVNHTLFKTLTLNYDTGGLKKYATRNVFELASAHRIKITVQTITFTSSGGATLPAIFRLAAEIIIDRKYKFDCTKKNYPNSSFISAKNLLNVTWNAPAGSEEYDLEWTYYHDSSAIIKKYKAGGNYHYDSLYKNNSTRVTVTNNLYSIPLLYPDGYIFYRVRSAHYTLDNIRIVTAWTARDTLCSFTAYKYKYRINCRDSLLNWQSKVSFAEEGKRSPVVTYFDGTLRSRQILTSSDAIGKVIIGETFYDHQGRPALQTLPVPATNQLLGFHDMFNKNSSGEEYNREDFDLYGCDFSPPPMDSAVGASQYYSRSNPDYTQNIQEFIPAADGYAFTAMRYTPDLTGRVAQQGGAGKELRLGNGHETKYIYSKPSQEELDMLFGNDVGYDTLYFKNMVIDPNGSISISYLDGSGHTIATALAGECPANLQILSSNTGADTLTTPILGSNLLNSPSLTSTYSMGVEQAGRHLFHYSLTPDNFTPDCSDNADICFDCLYDLTIRITDACGNATLPGDTAFNFVRHNYTFGAVLDSLCSNSPPSIDDTFSLVLSVCEYHITKTLSVSDEGKTQYLNSYYSHDTCIKTYNDFLTEAISKIDFSGCDMTCEACLDSLGDNATFVNNYISNLGYTATHQDSLNASQLYDDAYKNCLELCDTVSNECESIYLQLLNDVRPGGQYCRYLYDETNDYYIAADTSLLKQDTTDELFNNQDYTTLTYYDANGNPDTVIIGGYVYFPNQLSVDDFVHKWRDSWASSLVTLHPEYCYYQFCSQYIHIYEYPANMLNTSTYTDAIDSGYLNPLGLDSTSYKTQVFSGGNEIHFPSNHIDPFFDNNAYTPQMNDSMQFILVNDTLRLLTDWQSASMSANCKGYCDTASGFDDSCTANANIAWKAFRGIYLGERKFFVDYGFHLLQSDCYDIIESIGQSGSYENMQRHVYFYADMGALVPDSAGASSDLISICQSNCEALADQWIQILMDSCGFLPGDSADIDAIRAGLIEVCQSGCDATHPFGASTLPPGTTSPSGYISFQSVLDSILGLNPADTSCNAMALTNPPPYYAPSSLTPVFYGDYDTCFCHRLNSIHNYEYVLDSIATSGSSSFTEFLALHYESNLTSEQVNELLDACSGSCSWVNEPIILPEKLSCGSCIMCKDLYTAYENLPLAGLDTAYQAILLNEYFGFHFMFHDYFNFDVRCKEHWYFIDGNGEPCYPSVVNPPCCTCTVLPFSGPYYTDSVQLCVERPSQISYHDDTITCYDQLMNVAIANTTYNYQQYIDSSNHAIWDNYVQHCLQSVQETFNVDKLYNQYHFTLYYYDQASNLVQTVPPNGVHPITTTGGLDSVKNHRDNPSLYADPKYPNHTMETRYWYNTLNKLVKQWMPDGDTTRFWYDRLGRIVVSRNERQRPNSQYSYTLYDALGRIIEAGQLTQSHKMTFDTALNDLALKKWINYGTNKEQVTHTYYEAALTNLTNLTQENLRNRVASTTFEKTKDNDSLTYEFASHYSYDIAGNVKTLMQDNKKLTSFRSRLKRIDYNYDLVSGKVNKVYYEKDSVDQFVHWYVYDADNRLMTAYTSDNGLLWDMDANYLYYDHGPLGRLEIGKRQVQGVDYAYTLQGWLKGVNTDQFKKDMGKDGTSTQHKPFGLDAYGFTLSYYDKDYGPIGTHKFEMATASSGFLGASPSLFNGNISRAVYALKKLTDSTLGYSYHYDQLNRLVSTDAWNNYSPGSFSWSAGGSTLNKWKERVSYDANGNIHDYIRHGSSPTTMDSLTYHYASGKNQLTYIDDTVPPGNYTVDIDDQSSGNYTYDATGNLVSDAAEEISLITWTPYGKVDSIGRTGGSTKAKLKFYYDATGNRIGKVVHSGSTTTKTWYVRDAQGNIMSTYTHTKTSGNDTIRWDEQDIYGSTRIGIWQPLKRMYPGVSPTTTDTFHFTSYAGDKRFELTNHLGNVLSVVTDRKIPIDTNSNGVIDYYRPDVASVQDYYPFGMLEPGRSYSTFYYSFGYQGSLKDDELCGSGSAYSTLFRELDPRVGRWWTVDPKSLLSPSESPYATMACNPILNSDILGDIVKYQNLKTRIAVFFAKFGNRDFRQGLKEMKRDVINTINFSYEGGSFSSATSSTYSVSSDEYGFFAKDLSQPNSYNVFFTKAQKENLPGLDKWASVYEETYHMDDFLGGKSFGGTNSSNFLIEPSGRIGATRANAFQIEADAWIWRADNTNNLPKTGKLEFHDPSGNIFFGKVSNPLMQQIKSLQSTHSYEVRRRIVANMLFADYNVIVLGDLEDKNGKKFSNPVSGIPQNVNGPYHH